jgi:hypothetical protein
MDWANALQRAYGRAAQEQHDELWNNMVHYKDAMNAAEKYLKTRMHRE